MNDNGALTGAHGIGFGTLRCSQPPADQSPRRRSARLLPSAADHLQVELSRMHRVQCDPRASTSRRDFVDGGAIRYGTKHPNASRPKRGVQIFRSFLSFGSLGSMLLRGTHRSGSRSKLAACFAPVATQTTHAVLSLKRSPLSDGQTGRK